MGKQIVDTLTGEIRERHATPFADVILALRRGLYHDELTEALADIVEAVQLTAKAGKLTVTLTVKKLGKGYQVTVDDDVKVVLPRDVDNTIMFGHDGRLTREDPWQEKLPLGPRPVEEQAQ